MAKVRMHAAMGYACILAVAITAHKTGRPELANSIKTFAYQKPKTNPKTIIQYLCALAVVAVKHSDFFVSFVSLFLIK